MRVQHSFTKLCAMRLFCVTEMAPLRYQDGVSDIMTQEVRSVSIGSITDDSGSKPRGSRSHQRQQQRAGTFASSCFPDILVNVVSMNTAARSFGSHCTTYMYMISFVTEPGNNGYRRISVTNFSSDHEKLTLENT